MSVCSLTEAPSCSVGKGEWKWAGPAGKKRGGGSEGGTGGDHPQQFL